MAKKHTHKYYRADLSIGRVFACSLPECTHYMPKHLEGLLNGRNAICWGCDEQFVLDPAALKMDQPKCHDCRMINTKLPEFVRTAK